MKTTSSIDNKKASPLVNAAIVAVLLFTALPIALFGIIQILPPLSDTTAKTAVEDTAPRRSSVSERRAERREARKAKELASTSTRTETTVVTMDQGFDGFGMMPGADMGGFGGFGMMPGADMGGFGGFGMMPGADMGGFGGFGGDMGAFGDFGGGFGGGFGGFGGGFGGFGGGFGDIGELPGNQV